MINRLASYVSERKVSLIDAIVFGFSYAYISPYLKYSQNWIDNALIALWLFGVGVLSSIVSTIIRKMSKSSKS